jgi:signal transduction histidine kinase
LTPSARASRRAARRPAGVAAVVALAFTAVVTVVPFVRFAYDNLSLHVALETSEALIGALLAYLALGRYRASGAFDDLALAVAFALLACTNLLLSAVPVVALEARPVGFVAWAAAGLRLVGGAAFCAAAVASPRTVVARRRVVATLGGAIAAVVVLAVAADAWLADAIDPALSPSMSSRPHISAHPVVLSIQLVGFAVYAVAAIGFVRRSAEDDDELRRWLAAGAVLAAVARVHYFLFPSLYSNWVYTGDLLRLASYLLFLVGASREIRAYWESRARLAVVDERGRLARQLHDGLVQELSFVRSQTAGARSLDGERLAFVAAAAERALAESRVALDAWASAADEPLDVALRRVAADVTHRAGATVDVVVGGADVAGVALRGAMLGIVREAATNAVRHGRAANVRVGVEHTVDSIVLTIADDGAGFDVDAVSRGFGLGSMIERARLAGGSVDVRSSPGAGTVVRAVFPRP